jgi:hypothetical protein
MTAALQNMEPTSKVLTNMGLILATVGEHQRAVETFIQATNLDQYLAIALVASSMFLDNSSPCLWLRCFHMCRYFQCGVSNFLLQRWEFALKDFDDAWLYLRGNTDM